MNPLDKRNIYDLCCLSVTQAINNSIWVTSTSEARYSKSARICVELEQWHFILRFQTWWRSAGMNVTASWWHFIPMSIFATNAMCRHLKLKHIWDQNSKQQDWEKKYFKHQRPLFIAWALDLCVIKPKWIWVDLSALIMWCGLIIAEKKIFFWGRWREWTVKCRKKLLFLIVAACLCWCSLYSGLIILRSRRLLWRLLLGWKRLRFYNFSPCLFQTNSRHKTHHFLYAGESFPHAELHNKNC